MAGLASTSPEDHKKFKSFMEAGLQFLQEIEDKRESLKDLTKSLAEEYGIAPAQLTIALRTVFKNSLANKKEEMDVVEEIIHITGHS